MAIPVSPLRLVCCTSICQLVLCCLVFFVIIYFVALKNLLYNENFTQELLQIEPTLFTSENGFSSVEVADDLKSFSSPTTLGFLKFEIAKYEDNDGLFKSVFFMLMKLLAPINVFTTVLVPKKPLPYLSIETMQFIRSGIIIAELYDPFTNNLTRVTDFSAKVFTVLDNFPKLQEYVEETHIQEQLGAQCYTLRISISDTTSSVNGIDDIIEEFRDFTIALVNNYRTEVKLINNSTDLDNILDPETKMHDHLRVLWKEGMAATSLQTLLGDEKTEELVVKTMFADDTFVLN